MRFNTPLFGNLMASRTSKGICSNIVLLRKPLDPSKNSSAEATFYSSTSPNSSPSNWDLDKCHAIVSDDPVMTTMARGILRQPQMLLTQLGCSIPSGG